MTDASQPEKAMGKMLPAGILATALFALLAFAPFASAATDPVSGGSTTITLNSSFTKYLGTFGIKVLKIKPATLKGSKATFKVTGGNIDPTTGKGELTHSGGLKIKAGKKSVAIKGLVVNTTKKQLIGKVGGKKATIAKLAGIKVTRKGFNVNVNANKVKLTPAAANLLNKKLGFAGGKPLPFLKNKLIGKTKAEAQPGTVTVVPAGNLTFNGDPTLLGKLKNVKAEVVPIAPTTQAANVFGGPLLGGTVSPTGTAGTVQSGVGVTMFQKLPTSPTTAIETTITLGGMYLDLAAKTVTVEVVADSNAESPAGSGKFPLKLGNLGRSSIADLTITGVTTDPATRTVSVNSSAVLQPISAEVLQGFVSVYQAYIEGGTELKVCEALPEKCKNAPEQEIAKAKAKEEGAKVAANSIKSGEALGTFSFTAQTE